MALTAIHNEQAFKVGDIVRVHQVLGNGRIQAFQGMVIGIRGKGTGKSFIVRRVVQGIGIERIFPLYAPVIAQVEVLQPGDVRRAKLYYLRQASASKMADITKRYLRRQASQAASKKKVKKEKKKKKKAGPVV